MRSRSSVGYIAFIIVFIIINGAPVIFRAFTEDPEGLVGVFSDVGDLTKYLGGGAIIAAVLYFVWTQIGPNVRKIDNNDDEIEASRKQSLD